VKILDFGVAKILASPDGAQSVKTRTGSLMGTPLYMSPEQCKGAGALDHRTDIYSLGVMLFEMLAGRPPFMAEGVGELFAKHMLEDPPAVTEFVPNAPPHMAAAIMKSLAKEPEARFQSMDDFRKALVGEVKVTAPRPATMVPGSRRASNTMVNTMSPKASTTLSSASSEIDESFDKPARSKRWVFVGGGAVAAAVIAFLVMGKSDPKPAVAPPAPPVAAVPAPPPPVAPPVKRMVTLRFEADPPGAHVFNKKDDKDLGVVPVEIQLAKDAAKKGESTAYVYRLPGYKELALNADTSTDRTFHVSLDKLPAPPAEAKHKGGGAKRVVTAKKSRTPVDEDGLATPSF
jgi:serine/threonine-protein kinase